MILKRVFFVLAGFFIANAPTSWAGDSATFVNLGFSADGSYYMFSQFGVRSDSLRPWADLFVVDVGRNNFVPGGRISYTHERPIVAGQNGAGAMHSLIAQNAVLSERHGVRFPNQGQPLYIALAGDPALENQTVTFRDFQSGFSYVASLSETVQGSGASLRSSFNINLASNGPSGQTKTFTIGTSIWRPGILSYRIRQVLISPSGNSMVFVVEMRQAEGDTHNIRYMVEAVRL